METKFHSCGKLSHMGFGAFDIRFLCYMSQAIHSLIKCKIE